MMFPNRKPFKSNFQASTNSSHANWPLKLDRDEKSNKNIQGAKNINLMKQEKNSKKSKKGM